MIQTGEYCIGHPFFYREISELQASDGPLDLGYISDRSSTMCAHGLLGTSLKASTSRSMGLERLGHPNIVASRDRFLEKVLQPWIPLHLALRSDPCRCAIRVYDLVYGARLCLHPTNSRFTPSTKRLRPVRATTAFSAHVKHSTLGDILQTPSWHSTSPQATQNQ